MYQHTGITFNCEVLNLFTLNNTFDFALPCVDIRVLGVVG